MKRISEELIEILRSDIPGPNSLSNTALMYMNRQTYEQFKAVMQAQQPMAVDNFSVSAVMSRLFGVAIMLYHGIPDGRWELVQRSSGEHVNSGNVFKNESGALCGYRWVTYSSGLVPDTREHQCIIPVNHWPRSHCVCECGQASVVPPQ